MTGEKETFHNVEQFMESGLERFLAHANAYLNGKRTVPVCKATPPNGGDNVTYTFSDVLLRRFVEDTSAVAKPYEVAIKYGFGGHSKGGRNGIFYQTQSKNLSDAIDGLIESHEPEVLQRLGITKEGLSTLEKVKIVWHNNSGERIVGAYNPGNKRMIFLDFASY